MVGLPSWVLGREVEKGLGFRYWSDGVMDVELMYKLYSRSSEG